MLYLSSLLLRLMSQFFDLANSEHVATTAMLRRSRHNLLSLINLPNTTKCLVFFPTRSRLSWANDILYKRF